MSSFCARDCNSQWPFETHTEQMWFRSVKSSSRIARRYFCKRSELVVTCMPSSTEVTQAGSNFDDPFISTRHKRQAPTSDSPFNSQRVGRKIPFCRATSRMVSSWRALTSRSSILSVLILLAGLIGLLPDLRVGGHRLDELLPIDGPYKRPPGTGRSRCALCILRKSILGCSAPDSELRSPSRTSWCASAGRKDLRSGQYPAGLPLSA